MLVKLWILSLLHFTFGNSYNVNNSFHEVNGTFIRDEILKSADGPFLVTSDIVVAENITLTIEAGAEIFFIPTVGLRIHGSLHAKGTPSNRTSFRALSCNETIFCNSCSNFTEVHSVGIRLVDGTSYNNGRLELQWNGQWGTVCDRYWDYKDTLVACRQLGFLGAKRHYNHHGSSPILMTNVHCAGNEDSLWRCRYYGIGQTGCGHYQDIGIECETLLPCLIKEIYWKGIHFDPSNSSYDQSDLSLENVDIVNAVEAIKALKKSPDLVNVTIRESASGLLVEKLEGPLKIVDSTISRCKLVGINITSYGGPVEIQNVSVQNTTYGYGLVYKQISRVVDFCSIVPGDAQFPLVLNASGVISCSKIFRAPPGKTISAHFRLIGGSDYEVNVTDGSTPNRTLLSKITNAYNGKTIRTVSCSVLEVSVFSGSSSRVPANIQIIIQRDQELPVLLSISHGRFSNNGKSGIEIYDLVGQAQISNTAVTGGGVGLHMNRTHGMLFVLSSTFLNNKKHGLHIEKITGMFTLRSVNASQNQGAGIEIREGSAALLITNCKIDNNNGHGLHVLNQINSTLNISQIDLINDGGNGIYFHDFTEECQARLSRLSSLKNSQNGALFEKLSMTDFYVSSSTFDTNSINGIAAHHVRTINITFLNISTSNNYDSGIVFTWGKSNINVDSWSSINNRKDGLYLVFQDGQLRLKDCFLNESKRNGLNLLDSSYARLRSFHIQNSSILQSGEYGIFISIYNGFHKGLANYSITVVSSTIANNTLGGIYIYPRNCYRYDYSRRRHVQLSFVGNEVSGNQKYGIRLLAPETYEFNGWLKSNVFKENAGTALQVDSGRDCPFSVSVELLSNIFIKNEGERVIYIDYYSLPKKRFAVIRNNTFLDNNGVQLFSNRYLRTKAQAVVTLKEGNFTIEGNSFDNPLFSHDIATVTKDYERTINATENWWGSHDECEIKRRIFDFEDRVELAKIRYFPFLESRNSSNKTLWTLQDKERPICFIKGNKIGGIVDRDVTLRNDMYNARYEVTGDIIVSSNGTLTIEENVTLEFPLQAIFIVQGQVIIKGSEKKRVKFVPRKPLHDEIRLVDGPEQWDGRLEIWLNNTWMSVCSTYSNNYVGYLSTITCRQLGYEPYSSSYRYTNGREKIFLRNVRCATDENDNIIQCNRENWFSDSTCTDHVFYVRCGTPYWAGVHLALMEKKSVIENLDISYAGFAYREDLYIPGASFRTDLTHHYISGVLVNNSATTGLQVVYPHPFKNSHDLANFTIMNIARDGIRLEYPFLNLVKSEVSKTNGYGLLYSTQWNARHHDHLLKMADPGAKKYIDICSENVTYINGSALLHYLIVSAENTHNCESVVKASTEYRFGMQLLFYEGNFNLYIYSGTNTTSSDPWEIHKLNWYDSQTWISTSSLVLLKSLSHNKYTAHFMLYMLEGSNKAGMKPAGLTISQSSFTSTAGIYLKGRDLRNVDIENSVIRGTPNAGLRIQITRYANLNLRVFKSSLLENRFGITMNSFSGNISLENSTISNSSFAAIDVKVEGSKTLHIVNSSILHCMKYGILINGNHANLKLFVINSYFRWNEAATISSSYGQYGEALFSFKNNTFIQNKGPFVHIVQSHYLNSWLFEGNLFINNTASSVVMLSRTRYYGFSPEIYVIKNQFILNFCQEKGIIDIDGGANLIVDGNVFDGNNGRLVYVEDTLVNSLVTPVSVTNNVFRDNNCSDKGVVEIRRMDSEVTIANNVFTTNKGPFMVFLQCVFQIKPGMVKQNLTFSNNTLVNNTEVPSRLLACEFTISGLVEYKAININGNSFNSYKFSKELCVNILASSHRDSLDVTLNYWGYEKDIDIRKRIFDAEDNHEVMVALFIPFINKKGTVVKGRNITDLGGRLSTHVKLRRRSTPYLITSDLVILPTASLTIEPGVEVQFGPGVSMLVLGSLFALGTADHPVKFSLLKKTQKQSAMQIRLTGGKYPWLGRLEILHKNIWAPVCFNMSESWKTSNAKVICQQLGYQSSSPLRQNIVKVLQMSSTSAWPIELNCLGSEANINECPSFLRNVSCNCSHYFSLTCGGGMPWGNVRFLREFKGEVIPASRLEHLHIENCGIKNGKEVAAIEVTQYVPEIDTVHVLNCTAGGVKVLFPEKEIFMRKSSFINTGGNGVEIVSTEWNVTLDRVVSLNNKHGVTFNELDQNSMQIQSLSYGQIMFCSLGPTVNFTRGCSLFLYFYVPRFGLPNPPVTCHKVIQAARYEAFFVKLVVLQKSQVIAINDPFGTQKIRSSYRAELKRLKTGVFLPWNPATIHLFGSYDGGVLLLVKRLKMQDIPCAFERQRDACGWQNYPGSTLQGITLSRKWFITQSSPIRDHTYSSAKGRYMYLGARYGSGYGALISPPILKENDTCFLVFYYRLWMTRYASLSVLIEGFPINASSSSSTITPLWATNHSVTRWTKQALRLPQTYANYSVIFLGFYTASYYARYVALDDVHLKSCGTFQQTVTYRLTESTLSGNLGHGIRFTSTETKSHVVQIERSKIMNNGLGSALGEKSFGAIHLNATNQVFQIVNNYLADNNNGGIYAKLQKENNAMENIATSPASHIHSSTVERNIGSALVLEGTTGQTSNVKVINNYLSLNLATDLKGSLYSVCRMTGVTALFQGNVFFNNSGRYVVEFYFPQKSVSLTFLNNTLFRNTGLGANYGVTVLCNGGSEMHYNVFQNPNNRYEITTSLTDYTATVNAVSNWWGQSSHISVASLIRDKTKDYRLSLTVVFKPFLYLPPHEALSVSCPPEWKKRDELCFLYKGGSLTYEEAKEYCENNGAYIITMSTSKNRKLVKDLRKQESLFRSTVPDLWTFKTDYPLLEFNGTCYVLDSSEEIRESSCDGLHPFVCIRRPVMHCPNACFHNGECLGAVCHCYRGWTGVDCSHFHCPDLHDCSERGECVGPNVCKCYPGFLGRGCTYSYCGKYESCSDCITDPFCGWCDSLGSCFGGFAEGPPKISCPDWFFHHCYTVGDQNSCSNNIQRVDCKRKHCNFQEGRATTESCQKCEDLDKCYKITGSGRCRSWNETRCPGGQVQVDYADHQRSNNIELAKNVKLVDPNTTVIYSCPVQMDKKEEISFVFVAPKTIDVREGDILCSPQAGGIMHRIVKAVPDGPFKVMMSAPAGLEEVINYADFKEQASVDPVEDESTLEDEPDLEDLQDFLSGNITVNESQIIIFPAGSKIYKCVGHMYELENVIVYSYYLVIDKHVSAITTGDIVVSNTSDGFIETVVSVSTTEDARYMKTKLQRCNENSRWSKTRLDESKQLFSEATFCSGGDNNPGLLVLTTETSIHHFAVNDSIVGRPSQGLIGKVVKVISNGDVLLVEAIPGNVNENGTVSTDIDVTKLKSHHRRLKRSTEKDRKGTNLANFEPGTVRHKLISRGRSSIEARFTVVLRLTAFVEIEKKWYSWKIKDASVGLKLHGSIRASLDINVDGELRYGGGINVMKKKQLGGNKSIRLAAISIPAGIFLELTGQANIGVSGNLYHSLQARGNIDLGGECRWSKRGCYTTANEASLDSDWYRRNTNIETGAFVDITVSPKISIKVPVAPKWIGNLMKSSWFSPLKKLVGKVTNFVDLSLSIYVTAPIKVEISVIHPSSDCSGKTPAKLSVYYGLYDLICGVSVNFVAKHFDMSFSTGYSRMKSSTKNCFCPVPREQFCLGTTETPIHQGTTKPDIDDYKRPDKNHLSHGNKETSSSSSIIVKNPGPPCGKEPCCAGDRKGPGCTQPDLWRPSQPDLWRPLQGSTCSGNGIPQSTSSCGASCLCSGGWSGPFCDRASASGGGDPHLATLDGVKYDFFGIGEFWGCKSQHNDFGLQFRLFYYKQASLIGGVSLKAGRSIVAVMTVKAQDSHQNPIVRIDGVLLNVSNVSSKAVRINNGSVLLDHQIRFSFDAEDNGVLLISLQYESGITVTIDVRYSHVMKRQYLNILYSPTAAYKGHTEGLCGFMDNNATNDFTGPDGTLYHDAVQFAETWRIMACHNGSGTRDSWSWNSSNFFHEDIMDMSYTDPSFVPIYSLYGISEALLEIAVQSCKALGILDNDLQSCIFDVAVTNDTSFTEQEAFKRDCPNQCSGKGRCVNGTCRCIDGWTGGSCDQGSCVNCSSAHGKCIKGFCECDLGWQGKGCDDKATCHNVKNCTSPTNGVCKTTDVCQCNPGYTADDCSVIPTCHNVSNCSGNGLCVEFDTCKCDKGWDGEKCTQYSCERLDFCSEHGRCVGFYECACNDGWTGASCALPDCAAANQCSRRGECVSTNVCRCYPGFVGQNCSEVADCDNLRNCSGQGLCVLSKSMNASCRCYAGFTGPTCSHPTCTTVNNCSAHGACIDAELCRCDLGYNGTDCSNFSCEAVNFCSGRGKCVGFDLCHCNSSWSGAACNIPNCNAVNNCSGQGDCILPNTCACYPAFDGRYCDQMAHKNTNAPKFDRAFYNTTIKEHSPLGTMIFQVHAVDTDLGRNGEVFYSIISDKSVGNIFVIDGTTGKIYNVLSQDFESLETISYNLTILASDNGLPQKSASTIVQITVVDENDHCPKFTDLPTSNIHLQVSDVNPGDTITVVSAIDLDSGTNGNISYKISVNDAFIVHPKSGAIIVKSKPVQQVYDLRITAEDNGSPPCHADQTLTVMIGGLTTKQPKTDASSSHFMSSSKSTESESYSTPLDFMVSTTNKGTTDSTTSKTSEGLSLIPMEATLAPQKSPNYVVIGCSAVGGALVLLITALIIRKIISRTKVTPVLSVSDHQQEFAIHDESKLPGHFEMLPLPGKV